MIELQGVNFRYKNGRGDAGLQDINLHIAQGETVLLCGESGCGKTTLTRLMNGLVPHYYEGELSGKVTVNGLDVAKVSLHRLSSVVGSVFQNPRSQFFTVDTDSELAFGCENLGLPAPQINRRVADTVRFMSIDHLLGRSIFDLSGGEKQKLACASVWAAEPKVLVLDEPSANLDEKAIADLQSVLVKCKAAGITIIIAEHRLHYINQLADRVLYMQSGCVAREFTGEAFRALQQGELSILGLRQLTPPTIAYQEVVQPEDCAALTNIRFHYARGGSGINIPAANIPTGSVTALTGHNGAGKSTLIRCLCGLERKASGEMHLHGKPMKQRARLQNCYLVMQDVNHQLFCESVLEEVLISMPEPDEAAAKALLAKLDLLQYADAHPLSLSGGQKQRVAVASAVASGRPVILFDEPTSGLDLRHMQEVAALLGELAGEGKTVLVTTHDRELIAACCTYALHMQKGELTCGCMRVCCDEAGKVSA